ncbi:FadR/GntR family transcriptional regulator [Acidisoma sp. 7E03]
MLSNDELARPPEAKRLYQTVASQIRQLIASGRFPPLSRLPAERELAQILGVSRPSLREALIALEIGGSVEVRMGSGIYVTGRGEKGAPPDAGLGDSPSEIMEARIAVEGAVVVLACARSAAEAVARLRDLLDAMRRRIEAGDSPLQPDRDFHLAIAGLAGNSVLSRLVGDLFDARHGGIHKVLSSKFDSSVTWRSALLEHEAIVTALEARDPLRAEAAMRMHLQSSADRWLVS